MKKDQEAQHIYSKFHAKQKMTIVGEKQYTVIWTPPIRMAFLVHLIVRICLEILFIILAYILQTKQTNKILLQEVSRNYSHPAILLRIAAKLSQQNEGFPSFSLLDNME